MSSTALAIIKEDGAKQRIDVELSEAVANALVERVLQGLPLYLDEGALELSTEGGIVEIPRGTMTTWVTRGNVIPETGRRLRDVLDDARIEKKRIQREERQAEIIENGELALQELVKIPITSGRMITTKYKTKRGKKGEAPVYVPYGKVETDFEGVNPKLAEAKIKALTFGLERLEPNRYGAKLDAKHTHMVFSLSDLRRAKERHDEAIAEAGAQLL